MVIITEERRQQLIEFIGNVLAGHIQYGGDADEEDVYKIALASLKSKPLCWTDESELRSVETHQHGYIFNANPVSDFADSRRVIRLYRALPVPVMKPVVLPDYKYSPDMHTKQFYETVGFNMGIDACAESLRSLGYEVKE